MTTLEYALARDGEEFAVHSNGGDWLIAWLPPAPTPGGIAHGANAFCVTGDDRVVLISDDGERWGWPGAAPKAMSPGSRLSAERCWRKRARWSLTRGSSASPAPCASQGMSKVSRWYAPYGWRRSN